jgi:hypothetical protein
MAILPKYPVNKFTKNIIKVEKLAETTGPF